MAQHNTVNVKLSASKLNRLKSGTQNATDVTMRLSSNMTSDDEANLSH